MKCPSCSSVWPVDIVEWVLPSPCPGCNTREARDQLDRYKELYLLLTVKGELEFDQVVELYVGQMGEVYSDR